jgi:hypothetical protein
MTESIILGDRFFAALRYATHLHAGQVRKSTNIAYDDQIIITDQVFKQLGF